MRHIYFVAILLATIHICFFDFLQGDETPVKCVQIYYDKTPVESPRYYGGRIYAVLLQNLLGHFPHIQQYVIPIESYEAGQLDRCDVSIYLGSYYDNKIPQAFLDDFVKTKKNVAWLGYNIWKLKPRDLESLWGVQYVSLGVMDKAHRDKQGIAGYYKYCEYKGEIFEKSGNYSTTTPKEWLTNYDITLFKLLKPEFKNNVLSWVKHSTQTQLKTPYILHKNNHWCVADMPFSYMGVDDRYLIFADLLFDILNEQPLHPKKKPAFVRLEDVNVGTTEINQILAMSNLFHKLKIPFTISLIPIFSDPFGEITKMPGQKDKLITDSKEFVQALKYAKTKGATFIMHGITHQYGKTKNPFNGVSGSDFEFWDKVHETPIKEDAIPYILDRLAFGVEIMENAGFKPVAWMSPHYLSSPLDSVIFGKVFTWNIGRVSYWPNQISGSKPFPESLTFDQAGAKGNEERLKYLANLVVKYPTGRIGTPQLFPYEIYGDVFGQCLIPEDIGNIQSYLSNQVIETRTVDNMIKTIKRNRVLRDVWASYFLHAFLLNLTKNWGLARKEGDTQDLERLLQATIDAGYEFINLEEWVKSHTRPKTLPAIEIDPLVF